MPKKSEEKSEQAYDGQEGSYVYDFLYYDAQRIGSFQSQLGGYGALRGIKHHKGSGEESASGGSLKATGGIPAVGSAETASENKSSIKFDEALDSDYDPFWLNGLNLYNDLDDRGLLRRDLDKARIGDIIVVKGSLSVLDFGMLKFAWKSGALKQMVTPKLDPLPSNATGAARKARKEEEAEIERNTVLSIDVINSMPHTVQATLTTAGNSIWCTLGGDAMVGSSSDILLKHGFAIQGEWSMVGILDAIPDDEQSAVPLGSAPINVKVVQAAGTLFGIMVASLAPIVRNLLGRPADYYAVTPLLIFREVSGD